MFLNEGKKNVAFLIGGSITSIPTAFLIGTGSGITTLTQSGLITVYDKQDFTSIDNTTMYKIKYTGDWNSVEMSGIQLREFGIACSGSGINLNTWSRTNLPAVTFDGTNELRVVENWVVY